MDQAFESQHQLPGCIYFQQSDRHDVGSYFCWSRRFKSNRQRYSRCTGTLSVPYAASFHLLWNVSHAVVQRPTWFPGTDAWWLADLNCGETLEGDAVLGYYGRARSKL